MNNEIEKVKEFHLRFGQPIVEKPSFPSKERCDFRLELIREEFKELVTAVDNSDLKETVDGICDLIYVIVGTAIEFGLSDKLKNNFDETHRSNMTKACSTIEEAQATVDHYYIRGIDAYYEESDGSFLVRRLSDDKILKSVNYSPVNYDI
jgi:predicted HAD superfamily Cof-like phosphohydrolase